MPICPVCKQNADGPVCACGYDFTRAYADYPTLCSLSPQEKATRKAPASFDLQDTLEVPASQMETGGKVSYTGNGLHLSVSVPAKSQDGQVLCIHGKGSLYPVTNTHGDLLLTLREKSEHRPDLDVYDNLYLTKEQLTSGGSVPYTRNGKTISVTLPKEIRLQSQTAVRLHRQGKQDGSAYGDLYLTIQEKPEPEKVEIPQEPPVDLDLHENFYLTKTQLEQGCKAPYSVGSRKISVTVPAHSQPQQVLRLVGKGKKQGKKQGDLYLTLQETPDLKKPELTLYDNLYLTKEQMKNGGEVQYTQNGQSFFITVPKNAKPQQVLCIQRKGLREGDTYGDLHLTIQEKPEPEKVEIPQEPPVDLDLHENFYLTKTQLEQGCKAPYSVGSRKISVTVPAHSQPQQVLRLVGKGKKQGKKQGDLYLTLQETPDLKKPELTLYDNLYLTKEQMTFGGEVQYTQNGQSFFITVPKNAKPQQVLCIQKKGLREGDTYGDLHLTIQEKPEPEKTVKAKTAKPPVPKKLSQEVQLLPLTAEECKRGCTLKVKNRQGTYQQITVPAGSTPGQTLENGNVMIQEFSTDKFYAKWTPYPMLAACFGLCFLSLGDPALTVIIGLMLFTFLLLGRNNLLRPEIRSCRTKGNLFLILGICFFLPLLFMAPVPMVWLLFSVAFTLFVKKKKQPAAA